MSLSAPSREMLLLSRQLGRQCLRARSQRPRSRNPLVSGSGPSTRRTVATFNTPHHAGAISVIKSNVDTSSDEYKENERLMGEAMARLDALTKKVQQGGSAKAREKHLARKKMLPRDRVTALIDPGTTFLELSPLAGHELYPEAEVPAGGVVAGVGVVEGVTCMIVANDSTVKGGTYYPITVKKHLRAQAVAQENNLPYVVVLKRGVSAVANLSRRIAASTSSTPAAQTYLTRRMFSPTANTLGASSSTRRACQPRGYPRSRLSWVPARLAAPTSQP